MISHRVAASILVTYFDEALVNQTEERMRAILGKKGPKWKLSMWSDRPPMKERAAGLRLAKALEGVSEGFKLPIDRESSTWPSVAGLVPAKVGCMCGAGPVCREGAVGPAVPARGPARRALRDAAGAAGGLSRRRETLPPCRQARPGRDRHGRAVGGG